MKVNILLFSLSLILFTACNNIPESSDNATGADDMLAPSYYSSVDDSDAPGYYSSTDNIYASSYKPGNTTQQPPAQTVSYETSNTRKLIRNGSIKFESENLEQTLQSIKAATVTFGGYLGSENTKSDSDRTSTRVTVRIPSVEFDNFLSVLSKDVKEFEERNISSKDVTEEFVDLNARITTKKKVEQRFIEILKTAKTVKEILEVESEIGAIREEIERAEGRLKYLKDQTAMSTIFIEFYQDMKVNTAEDESSFIADVKEALSNGLSLLSNLFIGIINIWPLILLAFCGYLVYRFSKKASKTSTPD